MAEKKMGEKTDGLRVAAWDLMDCYSNALVPSSAGELNEAWVALSLAAGERPKEKGVGSDG